MVDDRHFIILPAVLAFATHAYAWLIVSRKDRRRPCAASIRLIAHPLVFAAATIAVAIMLEFAGMKYQHAAASTWQWATITSLIGLALSVSILAGKRGRG